MSRKATMEYVGAKRRAYSKLKSKKAKSAAIDDFCQVTGAERKYAIRLLTGNRKYRDHAGRGKTYTPGAEALFLRLWRASGRMTPQYLVTVADRQMAALRELEHVDEAAAAQVLRMSASTMERILRKHPREAPRRRNRRSGANALASSVPCVPGEALPPAAPGDTQVDTVALCGGDMSGNFFWILTLTDRLTQWTELRCVWNRGAAATKEGLADAEAAFPFPLTAMHSDSGLEFLNAHVLGYARDRPRPSPSPVPAPGTRTTTPAWSRRTPPSSASISATSASTASSSRRTWTSCARRYRCTTTSSAPASGSSPKPKGRTRTASPSVTTSPPRPSTG
ncbi:MAG: hypothetical protein ACOX7Q_09250 [Kiritimatiellia bacterium]